MFESLMKVGPKSPPEPVSIKSTQSEPNLVTPPNNVKDPEPTEDNTQTAAIAKSDASTGVASVLQAGSSWPAAGESRPELDASKSGFDETAAIKPNQTESNPENFLDQAIGP
jgi:hypothetical protein